MHDVLLVDVNQYQETQWAGMVDDMRALIRDGLDHRESFVRFHAIKRGINPTEAQAALIQAKEF